MEKKNKFILSPCSRIASENENPPRRSLLVVCTFNFFSNYNSLLNSYGTKHLEIVVLINSIYRSLISNMIEIIMHHHIKDEMLMEEMNGLLACSKEISNYLLQYSISTTFSTIIEIT